MPVTSTTLNPLANLNVKDFAKLVGESVTNVMNTGGYLRLNPYSGDYSYRALEFIEDFNDCAKAKGWSDANKFDRFGMYLSDAAKSWFKLTMHKSVNPPSDWDALSKAFIAHHLPKDKERYYREQLSKRKQGTKEPVSQYIIEKRLLCLEINDK